MAAIVAALLLAGPAAAQDVIVLGEVHDNPAHHRVQAQRVAALRPKALVFEMLTPDHAARVSPDLIGDADALADLLDWANSGWPDFSYYYPIFAAAPDAVMYGAGVSRDAARGVMETGLATAFGAGAAEYGLDAPLPDDQQTAREALQARAHCGALPPEMLPSMVDVQRLRDASLARAARQAFDQTGGPVAVITGNGHARMDWGMPALLALAAPDLVVRALGQGEDGIPPGGSFDEVTDAPAPERGDPCAVFN
ncbi:hypothetical protein FGD77_05615 [Roseovarius sp. M141]|nr:ChaN family lipoprotein [Roseovarius sp. M141]MCQ0091186.1 hypothetical protein [Roseovarius sp. M141]